MEGTYSLNLTTGAAAAPHTQPPADGSMGIAVKRLSRFGDPSKIQIETWFSYTPAQDRVGIGEEDIRAFGFYFDIQDGEHRYMQDRKSTRLNSSHVAISYAVFCLKKKKQ